MFPVLAMVPGEKAATDAATAVWKEGSFAALAVLILIGAAFLVVYVFRQNERRETRMQEESLKREERLVSVIDTLQDTQEKLITTIEGTRKDHERSSWEHGEFDKKIDELRKKA